MYFNEIYDSLTLIFVKSHISPDHSFAWTLEDKTNVELFKYAINLFLIL